VKLALGIYKCKWDFTPFKHFYLFVNKNDGGTIYYSINGRGSSPVGRDGEIPLDSAEVIERVSNFNLKTAKINIDWKDEKGDEFEMGFTDFRELRIFFEQVPDVARLLGSKKY